MSSLIRTIYERAELIKVSYLYRIGHIASYLVPSTIVVDIVVTSQTKLFRKLLQVFARHPVFDETAGLSNSVN